MKKFNVGRNLCTSPLLLLPYICDKVNCDKILKLIPRRPKQIVCKYLIFSFFKTSNTVHSTKSLSIAILQCREQDELPAVILELIFIKKRTSDSLSEAVIKN
jgi:hypothetical protein